MAQLERELADHYTKYPRPSQPADMVIHSVAVSALEIYLVLYLHNIVGVIVAGTLSQRPGASSGSIKCLVPTGDAAKGWKARLQESLREGPECEPKPSSTPSFHCRRGVYLAAQSVGS
jgi:hypothetical protein